MRYRLIGVAGKAAFEQEVNREMRNGWEPVGGVSVNDLPVIGLTFYQAMVKYPEFNYPTQPYESGEEPSIRS